MKRLALMSAALEALCNLSAAAQTSPSMQAVRQAVFALHDFSHVAISRLGDTLAWENNCTRVV